MTKTFSVNLLKTRSLKNEKKTSIEAQNEGHALVQKTSESSLTAIDENESKKGLSVARDMATPIKLHL